MASIRWSTRQTIGQIYTNVIWIITLAALKVICFIAAVSGKDLQGNILYFLVFNIVTFYFFPPPLIFFPSRFLLFKLTLNIVLSAKVDIEFYHKLAAIVISLMKIQDRPISLVAQCDAWNIKILFFQRQHPPTVRRYLVQS